MRIRTLVVVACSASAVVASVALIRPSAAPPAGPASPAVDAGPARAAGPPEFPPVRDEQDRIVHWLKVMETGGDNDVAWAQSRLRLAGPAGRRVVREAAQLALESNVAFVEQGLEFLAVGAADEDAPLAVAALSAADSQAVLLSMKLLSLAPGRDRDATSRAVAKAAAAGDHRTRIEAASTLQAVGGDVAAAEAVRLVGVAPGAERAGIYRALGGFRHETVHAALAAAFATETDLTVRFALAEALVRSDDPAPVPWLESIVASPPKGPIDYADPALEALSMIRHPASLQRIGDAAADPLEDARVRIAMIGRLARYPLAAARKFLEAAAADAPGNGSEVRVEALEALIRAGADDVLAGTARLALTGDAPSAFIAALVFGRVRRPDAARPLVDASRRADLDDKTRAMLLRAVELSGAPETATVVVRAMAADHSPYDARFTVAGNVGSMIDEATPTFRRAFGADLRRALREEFGPISGAGLVELLRNTVVCCGEEASADVSRHLGHADAPVRVAAATALGYIPGPDAERDLRAAWWRWSDAPSRAAIATAIERAHFRFAAGPR